MRHLVAVSAFMGGWMRKVELADVKLPSFTLPDSEPSLPRGEYQERIGRLQELLRERSLHALVVYGDREHSANMEFLCGYDPRFEEALLIIRQEGKPVLMVGNEGWGYSEYAMKIDAERILVQCFSLMGQRRDRMRELKDFLEDAGLRKGMRVGTCGWKYFTELDFKNPERALEIPEYIAAAVRGIVGESELVVNACDLLMHPEYGMRAVNSVDQIAVFEFAATTCSQHVHSMIESLHPGMTEYEAVQSMRLNGMPLSCHLMLSSGDRAWYGMCSPSMKRIMRGDPLMAAVGLRGALTVREGYVVEDERGLKDIQPDYVEEVCKPYFSAIVDWYESVRVGVTGGEVERRVSESLRAASFRLALNPGHLIHLDEWLNSPFTPGSRHRLRSGMTIQVDLITSVPKGKFGTNLEDGIAVADEDLRSQLEEKYPETYRRVEARRRFMSDVLGVRLHDDVLPLSDYPAVLRPFLLSKEKVLVTKG
jgi:Xaa-Pro aminopeptidase